MPITTSVGLMSGIDTGNLIKQLMAIERQPLERLQAQVVQVTSQKAAYSDIAARLIALKSSTTVFGKASYFDTATATSSNTAVLGVTVTGTPAVGSQTFTVDRVTRAHHVLSCGFATANQTSVGGTTITIESGASHLDRETDVSFLNGQQGIERGTIRITDRTGASALIDLSAAVTVNDILNAINTQSDANVTASVSLQGLVIADNTGASTSNLKVENVGLTRTAASLGIAGSVASSTLTGSAVNYVTTSTSVDALNNGLGLRDKAGLNDFRITSSAGVMNVNVSSASTVQDILDLINNHAKNNGNLTASLSADGLSIRLVDSTGGVINVTSLDSSKAAQDLGLAGKFATTGTLTGEPLISGLNSVLLRDLNGGSGVGELVGPTMLADLNAGAGVAAGSISIRDRSGATAEIDLSSATTIADVVNAINSASAIGVSASVAGDHIVLTDVTGSTTTTLRVDEAGSTTAADLGIAGEVGGNVLQGGQIVTLDTSTSLAALNNGAGVRTVVGNDLRIWMDATTSFDVDLTGAATIQDALDAINGAAGNSGANQVTASIGGGNLRLVLTGAGLGEHEPTVEMLNGSGAALDLGLMATPSGGTLSGRQLLSNLSLESHREVGQLFLVDRSGQSALIDLSAVTTLGGLIDAIHASGIDVKADVNTEGNGIEIADTSGSTSSNLVVISAGAFAESLGLNTTASGVAATLVNGDDLDLRYRSENTRLADMNGGEGVSAGKFRITNRVGVSAVVDLTQEDDVLLEDVIQEINSRGISVTARINDSGDGIILIDTSGGGGTLKVEEVGSGTTARDLRILGSASAGTPDRIDGTEEVTIDISNCDGLEDIAAAINASGAAVSASVINDGSGYSPYRLSVVSQRSGSDGRIIMDVGDSQLRFSTVQRGQDAVIRYGSSDAGGSPVVLTSSTNTFDDIVRGLSLTVVAPSPTPVTVTVARDTSAIVSKVKSFVEAYNGIVKAIDTYSSYDPETEKRGLLQGDGTLLRIEGIMTRRILASLSGLSGTVTRLSQLGIKFKRSGQLEFDEEKLRSQITNNLSSVKSFFATENSGFADAFEEMIDGIANSYESILSAKSDGIERRIELYNERIEAMGELLAAKEKQLTLQFTQMEIAIGKLQGQSSYLSAISNFKWSNSSSSDGS